MPRKDRAAYLAYQRDYYYRHREEKLAARRQGRVSHLLRFLLKIWARGDCWEWRGYQNRKGYGTVRDGPETTMAHRMAYAIAKGPIPAGHVVDHRCGHEWCVRPSHLITVPAAQNNTGRRGGPARFQENSFGGGQL